MNLVKWNSFILMLLLACNGFADGTRIKECEVEADVVYQHTSMLCDVAELTRMSLGRHTEIKTELEDGVEELVGCYAETQDPEHKELFLSSMFVIKSSEFFIKSNAELSNLNAPISSMAAERALESLERDCFRLAGAKIEKLK
jgi:hypothetical protein